MAIPQTRFAARYDEAGQPVISTIDWDRVASEESHQVVLWILYLYRQQDSHIRNLLSTLKVILYHDEPGSSDEWSAYAEAQLPCVLVDFLISRDMFQLDVTSFKHFSLGNEMLAVLMFSCMKILKNPESQHHRDCISGLFGRRDRFYADSVFRRNFNTFAYSAFNCVQMMIRITEVLSDHVVLLTTMAPDFILYYWVYTTTMGRLQTSIIMDELFRLDSEDRRGFAAFANRYVDAADAGHLRLLLAKLTRYLRRGSIVGYEATCLTRICSVLVCEKPDVFALIPLPEGTGLLPSLIKNVHRQYCNSSRTVAREVESELLTMMHKLLNAKGNDMKVQHVRYAGKLNMIAILGRSFIRSIEVFDKKEFVTAHVLLLQLQEPISNIAHETGSPRNAPLFAALLPTTQRVWHDVMDRLQSISPLEEEQAMFKAAALRSWVMFPWLQSTLSAPSVEMTTLSTMKVNVRQFHIQASAMHIWRIAPL
ncbi:hypothetical protein EIP91_005975 [Steccherinum ochraceum]|uniref:Uncharacterized protein n=1 Tax=Steccherinum ochraceum TaxID=92696 RepID=A0A4V2MVQ6_9APHY|nr:hypothetical protein EIP91_005975 [Steccherinum ochraceum]